MSNKRDTHFPAAIIAIAAGVSTRTVHRRAARGRWARRVNGNEFDFQPPRPLLAKCRKLTQLARPRGLQVAGFTPERRAEMLRAVHRLFACMLLASALDAGGGREAALRRVAHVTSFKCSARSLRRWFGAVESLGIVGLSEHKRGVVGRRSEYRS
jgi:hypothetical protein